MHNIGILFKKYPDIYAHKRPNTIKCGCGLQLVVVCGGSSLFINSSHFLFDQNWKQRWFTLNRYQLKYFKDNMVSDFLLPAEACTASVTAGTGRNIAASVCVLQCEEPIRTLDLTACSAVQFDYSQDRVNCFWWVTLTELTTGMNGHGSASLLLLLTSKWRHENTMWDTRRSVTHQFSSRGGKDLHHVWPSNLPKYTHESVSSQDNRSNLVFLQWEQFFMYQFSVIWYHDTADQRGKWSLFTTRCHCFHFNISNITNWTF